MESLLNEMISFESPGYFPIYTAHQESSYDRRSVSPDSSGWFANNDGFGFIRTDTVDGRIEKVLFDQVGAGAITRIWMTALNKKGTLRFYFDGQKEAEWAVPAYDMMKFGIPVGRGILQPHTSYTESGKGGSTFFLPIPYAKGCKVTLETPLGEKDTPKYYHINYRKYDENISVETFSKEVADRNIRKIEEASNTLLNPPTYRSSAPSVAQGNLKEKDQLTLDMPAGNNSIRTIELDIDVKNSSTYAQTMREILLEITFDGVKTVAVPLSDFSGAGMGALKVDSWYLTADGKGEIISRWAMPYQKKAQIVLTNYATSEVNIKAKVHTSSFEWNDKALYFHSTWKQEDNIPLTNDENACIDWNFTTISGKGVYVGDVLSLFNHSTSWYGEGDEKIYIDHEAFPSHFGTGTEDYYNSSWAPVVPFYTPFGGAPRADLESSNGYNTFFRTRNLDAIPFQKQFRFDIEMLSWEKASADYAITVFWYGELQSSVGKSSGKEEFKKTLLPAPKPNKKYKIEDAIEFENLIPLRKSPTIEADVQNMIGFTSDSWSNGHQMLCVGGAEGDSVVFRLKSLESKLYNVSMYMTKAADYGKVKFYINGKPSAVDFDGYNTEVKNSKEIKLGTFNAEDGYMDVKIELVGTNDKTIGNRYFIGLDCIVLTEK